MSFKRFLRMVTIIAMLAMALSISYPAASQSTAPDSAAPQPDGLKPPSSPDWKIERVASHYLVQPGVSNDSHSFLVDYSDHSYTVYGNDRLYFADSASGSNWNIQVVDDYRTGIKSPSITISDFDIPFVSYCRNRTLDSDYQPLMFAQLISGTWYPEVVDNSSQACSSTSIAFDRSTNYPVIAYFSPGDKEIRLAAMDSNYNWHISTIVSNVGNMSGGVNLVIDSNNFRHISYFNGDMANHALYYVKSGSSGWEAPILVSDGVIYPDNSLVLDVIDYPYLAYVGSGGNLNIAEWNPDTGSFVESTVRSAGLSEYFDRVSLQVDASYNIYIVYHRYYFVDNIEHYSLGYSYKYQGAPWVNLLLMDGISQTTYVNLDLSQAGLPRVAFLSGMSMVYIACLQNAPCSTSADWEAPHFIDDTWEYYISSTSSVMDGASNMRISYYDRRHNQLMRAAENPYTGWYLDIMDNIGNVGYYSSEAIAPDGSENIAYYDATDQRVKIVFDNGAGYETLTVPDNTGDVGRYVSLKMDNASHWHLSYYDATLQQLKYAYYDSNHNWQILPLNAYGGDVGKYTSLVLDENYYPHIAYYDTTNSRLIYSYQAADGWHHVILDDPSTGSAGQGISLVKLPSGYAVAYYYSDDTFSYGIKYKSCYIVAGNCLWLPAVIVTDKAAYKDEATGDWPGISLAVDQNYRAFISFQADPWSLALASKNGASWNIELIDQGGMITGMQSSLAIDQYGMLHISYIDGAFHSLMVAIQKSKIYLPITVK